MRLFHLIPSLSLLVPPVFADTTYGCWSDEGGLFPKDCMLAATFLIVGQMGSDLNCWIPPYFIERGWGSCIARIRGSGDGNVVAAVNLLESFESLGGNCQNGWFYYDWGWIDAELNGVSGYLDKREEASANNTILTERQKKAKIAATYKGAKSTWNETKLVPYYESKAPAWLTNNAQGAKRDISPATLEKRVLGPLGGSYWLDTNGGQWTVYLAAQTVQGLPMQAMYQYMKQDLQRSALNEMTLALGNFNNFNIGNSVSTAIINNQIARLNYVLELYGYSTWHDLIEQFGGQGYYSVSQMVLTAIDDLMTKRVGTIGFYEVRGPGGNTVFEIVLTSLRSYVN